jgi:hypothetical protein
VKYVSVYGWGYYNQQDIPSGFSNEIEYYIIQDRGSYNPTQGGQPFGSATIDGIEYNFFTTDRRQQPSLSGTSTFKQYWSIPKNTSQHRTKGTISISKHFEAWAKAGMKMGKLYEVASMKIESYTGSGGNARGSATVKKNLLTIGGPVNSVFSGHGMANLGGERFVTVVGRTLNISPVGGSKLQVRVVDVNGKVQTIFNTADAATFSLSSIPSGLYFLDVYGNGIKQSTPIVLE